MFLIHSCLLLIFSMNSPPIIPWKGFIPSKKEWDRNRILTNDRFLSHSLLRWLQGCDGCDQTEDDPWSIGCSKWDIAFFFEESVVDPKATVDGCDKGLNKVSFVTSKIIHNLWEVRDIHHNRHKGRNPTKNFHLFFIHFYDTFHFLSTHYSNPYPLKIQVFFQMLPNCKVSQSCDFEGQKNHFLTMIFSCF